MKLIFSLRTLLAVTTVALSLTVAGTAAGTLAAAPAGTWVYPVGPASGPAQVARGFDPPARLWLSGHRGVDLRAPEGSEVRAAAAGAVTYAGMLAGRGVVVIGHGALRTTYQPVDATVPVGTEVAAGAPIGTLTAAGSHCSPASCLHWGALEGSRYVDPLSLVGSQQVRLLPLNGRALTEDPPPPPEPPEPPAPPPPEHPPGNTKLDWPVRSPYVTSPYGMRTHPITGVHKLHDGTDFRAACGTPVLASAPGRVTGVGGRGAYGLQVSVEHGTLGEAALTTSYSHLSRFAVRSGQTVRAGDVVGWSGTTGMSTGCHLHFMVYADGSLTDPMTWLPAGT